MKYLHTMVRVENIEKSLNFYCNLLGLKEVRRKESEKGRFTLIFLAAENSDEKTGLLELTYNWDPEEYTGGRNFGHLAYSVKNIYEICDKLMKNGITINTEPLNINSWMDTNFPYWEGPISFSGDLSGVGYLEMTGY